MAILNSELKVYRSTAVSDAASNGGRLSANESLTNTVGNLFPNVSPAERTAGSTKYRKVFFKVANDDDLTLNNPRIWVDKNTPGDDRLVFWPGTQRDVQSAITGSERKYGAGQLSASVNPGVNTFDVVVEDGATVVFLDGDTVRITDKEDLNDAGNEEFHIISGAPSVVGNTVTIVIVGVLANGFSSVDTHISSIYTQAECKGSFDNFSVTSSGGSYDSITYPIAIDNIGTIEQTWTLAFTSATAYTITGDTIGSAGTGNTSSGASPTNPNFAKPYFTLSSAGFSGTFQSGDSLSFQTHPASIPVWVRRVVPAGTVVQANNTASFVVDGETE